MKNRVITISLMLIVLLMTINVKASFSIYKVGDELGSQNLFPSEVKRGDIVAVRVQGFIESGFKIRDGSYSIRWNSKYIDLVETNGKYYVSKNNHIINTHGYFENDFMNDGKYTIYFEGDNTLYQDTNYEVKIPLFEFKFRILDDVPDGIYNIYQSNGDGYIQIYNDDFPDSIYNYSYEGALRYKVGKDQLIKDYNPSSIDNNTYVIGKHLFTREGSSDYNGVLTTDYIMLASKSIESDNKNDMIIYLKNARGVWKNAITDETITPPNKFDISHTDMIENYLINGYYYNDSLFVTLSQFSEKEVYVKIRSDGFIIEGLGTLKGNIITMKIGNITYKITVSDSDVTIKSSNPNILSVRLNKHGVFGVDELFNLEYGSKQLLKQSESGIYRLGNREIYVLRDRAGELASYDLCIKEENSNTCSYRDIFNEWNPVININEVTYNVSIGNNKLTLSSSGNNTYNGVYVKEAELKMEDLFRLIENTSVIHITLNFDENDSMFVPVTYNTKANLDDYIPERSGYRFVEWRFNGQTFDPNTLITQPITLDAVWEDISLLAPELSITNVDFLTKSFNLDFDSYCVNCPKGKMDGFELYEKNGNSFLTIAESVTSKTPYSYTFQANVERTIVARVYVGNGQARIYSDYSNEITINTTTVAPAIAFQKALQDPGAPDYISYENGKFLYRINITNLDSFGYLRNQEDTEWLSYKNTGFTLFDGDDTQIIKNISANETLEVEVLIGSGKEFYVKPYYDVPGRDRAYGTISNKLVIDNIGLEAPTISKVDDTADFVDGYYEVDLQINSEDYSVGDNAYLIDGYVLYEKDGDNYEYVGANGIIGSRKDYGVTEYAKVKVELGTSKVFVAKVFVNIENYNAVESIYSSEIVIDNSTIAKPTVESELISYGDGKYTYNYTIDTEPYKLITDSVNNTFVYMPGRYQMVEYIGGEFVPVKKCTADCDNPDNWYNIEGDIDDVISFSVEAGTSRSISFKVFGVDGHNNRVYSYPSNSIFHGWSDLDYPEISIGTIPNYGLNEGIIVTAPDKYYLGSAPLFSGSVLLKVNGPYDYEELEESTDSLFPFATYENGGIELIPYEMNTFTAKLFNVDSNNQKHYGVASLDVQVDLLNPEFKYELSEGSDNTKYKIKTTANDYSIICQSVIINEVEYPAPMIGNAFEIDKSVIENETSITLKLKSGSEVTASLSSN